MSVEHALIDRAAQSTGKTPRDFILEAARRAAEEALLDRAVLAVSPKAYAAFSRAGMSRRGPARGRARVCKPRRGEGPMLTHADLLPAYLLRYIRPTT